MFAFAHHGMSEQFDVVFGEDWCEQNRCETSYKSCSLVCCGAQGRSHKVLTQSTETDTLSVLFILKAVYSETTYYTWSMFIIIVMLHSLNRCQMTPTCKHCCINTRALFHLSCLHSCRLSAMNHAFPLKNNDPPPPRKSYRLSNPEVAELNSQIACERLHTAK